MADSSSSSAQLFTNTLNFTTSSSHYLHHAITTSSQSIPKPAALLAFAAALLISLVGIIGNSITIAALVKFSARLNSTATTRFVINLAISDLVFCSLVLPLNAGRFLFQRWPFGVVTCRLYPVIYYGSVATSLMLITVITINRLILIAFNDHYRKLYTSTKVNLQIVFCYLFSYGTLTIPLFNIYGTTGLNAETFSCTILHDSAGHSPKKYLFTMAFLLPMTTIALSYSIIFAHVQRQKRGSKIRPTASKRDMRLTLLICVVFGFFLLCFCPLFIGNVLIPDDRYPYFHVLASIGAWTNACINPFIYFALNPRYRNAFKKLFRVKSSYNVANGTGAGAGGAQVVVNELSTLSESQHQQTRSIKWTANKKI